MNTTFKPYDKVWVMENNKPKQKIVFAVIESMDFLKRGTDIFYHLVDSKIGTGWGNNEGIRFSPIFVYKTKEELLQNL